MSINVQYGALETAAADIRQTTDYMNTELEDLKADVMRLMGTWEGEAQEAYRAKQKQWDDSAEELNKVLSSIGTAVQDALGRYQEGEGQATRMFS